MPKITLELTDAQIQSLIDQGILRENEISKIPWNPKGGRYHIDTYGDVEYHTTSPETKNFGLERETKEEAQYARDKMRAHNRLLAYVAEFDKDWKADWNDKNQEKYFVYFDFKNKYYIVGWSYIYLYVGAVYMSEKCAGELSKKLNSGEVVL